jgi:hypothetical protein
VAVVIEELEVQTQPQPAAPPTPHESPNAPGAVDARVLQAELARDTWRLARLAAD